MTDGAPAICVFGAGVVGRRIARQLVAAGQPFSIASRHGGGDVEGATARFVADAFDPTSLATALAGARVVINAAGPLRETAAPVLVGALAAGAHYVDVGGEQAVLQTLYERHDSTVRRAGLVALPGAGLDGAIGDLAAAWAATHVLGIRDDGEAVRTEPAPRLADDRPLDEVCTTYVFDDLVLSAGSQRAVFATVGHRPQVWRRDRWEPGRAGARRRVNAGPAMGGERDAVLHAGGGPITIPRHVAANLVASYVSTTRTATSGVLMRLLATAAPLLPPSARDVLAAYAPPEDELACTTFAVIAQVRRGFSAAQIAIAGHDPYTTTAAIAAWCARMLVARGPGPVGMRAPGELFRGEPALRELATLAELTIQPSFGT